MGRAIGRLSQWLGKANGLQSITSKNMYSNIMICGAPHANSSGLHPELHHLKPLLPAQAWATPPPAAGGSQLSLSRGIAAGK